MDFIHNGSFLPTRTIDIMEEPLKFIATECTRRCSDYLATWANVAAVCVL